MKTDLQARRVVFENRDILTIQFYFYLFRMTKAIDRVFLIFVQFMITVSEIVISAAAELTALFLRGEH